jgi:protein involved in polysaccharide export with SLBB domain
MGFADADRLIRGRLATVYRTARVQVSMGRMRTLEVYVLGHAARPGKVRLNGMATAFQALVAAGGPHPYGSLRDLRVMRGDREVARGDLYPFLLGGDRAMDPRLENGDVLFVGAGDGRVGVRGDVTRPAVYDRKGTMSLHELLGMAGGPTAYADLGRVRIERVVAHDGFRLEDVQLARGASPDSVWLSDQDVVTVLPLAERTTNTVTLDGVVRHPGDYELVTGMKLSQLVTRDRVLPEADLEHAEFRRIDPVTLTAQVSTVSLTRVWSGESDLLLRPLDAVTVFTSARPPASVTLNGEVVRPGRYSISPGERFSSLLARAGGVTPRGSLRAAVFHRPGSAAYNMRSMRRELLERRSAELDRQAVRAAGNTVALRAIEVQRALLADLDVSADVDRIALGLDDRRRWMGSEKDLVLEDGDQIALPVQPSTVTVMGSVMNPGTLAAERGGRVSDYIARAGGYTRDGGSIVVLRPARGRRGRAVREGGSDRGGRRDRRRAAAGRQPWRLARPGRTHPVARPDRHGGGPHLRGGAQMTSPCGVSRCRRSSRASAPSACVCCSCTSGSRSRRSPSRSCCRAGTRRV